MAFKWEKFGANKNGEKIKKIFDELSDKAAYVGWLADTASYEDGTSVAEVAAFNEYGTVNIPSRPFMKTAVDKSKDDILKYYQMSAKNIADGKADAEKVLNGLGVLGKSKVQESIRNGNWEPNAPATIKRKGSSKPLIDTGLMRDTVTYVIRGGK